MLVTAHGVPHTATGQLPICCQCLGILLGTGGQHISSARLSRTIGISSTAVQHSFSCFNRLNGHNCNCSIRGLLGFFGKVLGRSGLADITLIKINDLNDTLVGCGFRRDAGLQVDTTFSPGPTLTGAIGDKVPICPINRVGGRLRRRRVSIIVLAMPNRGSRTIASRLIRTKIRNVLGFAPIHLSIPGSIRMRGVSLAGRLRALVCFVRGGGVGSDRGWLGT